MVEMFFLAYMCVLVSALAAKSTQDSNQASLNHGNIDSKAKEIESIVRMYQQWEDKHQKEMKESNRLQADLFSASSPFYPSLLEMLPPTPPYPMNAKPMSPGPQWSAENMPSFFGVPFPRAADDTRGEHEGSAPTSGGKFSFGGEGVRYIPSQLHYHPSPPPLAPPPPPPPPPLFGAAGMKELERVATAQRKAMKNTNGASPGDSAKFAKRKKQDHIDVRTAKKKAKKKAFYPLGEDQGVHIPTAPSVADMLRSGSVLQQILSDHKEAKWMPEEHQRTIMNDMSAEEKAHFIAILEHYKATKLKAGSKQKLSFANPNSNSEFNDPKVRKKPTPPSVPGLASQLLEVEERGSLDLQQQRSDSLLRENNNLNTNRNKMRRRKFRGSNNIK